MYFFFLVLRVFFDFAPDIVNKCSGFSEILSKKDLEFVPSEEGNPIPLNLSLVLLPAEVNPISEKRGRKRDLLVARGTGHVEIIFTLLAEVVKLYMSAPII